MFTLGTAQASSSRVQMENVSNFDIELNIANQIMDTVRRLQLPVKLDHLTEGRGNCFPIAVLQQCRRPEILSQLRKKL
jgi:hypothetical protein